MNNFIINNSTIKIIKFKKIIKLKKSINLFLSKKLKEYYLIVRYFVI